MNVHIQGISSGTVLAIAPSTDVSFIGKLPRHTATISELSDDLLLEIFDICQKDQGPNPRFLALPEAIWDWHTLVHVCQRWRQVVFASPYRLNLRILCTFGTPVQKNLDIWPTFPIVIQYTSQIEDTENNIIAALNHPDRVSSVSLRLTGRQLSQMVTVMQEPFPALRHIFMAMHTSNDVSVFPCEFLGGSAPSLQTINLQGIPFPALPALLLSTSDLVTMKLHDIPQTGYISPEAMVSSLATLTRLSDLLIGFQSPDSRTHQISLPPTTRTVLPALTSFEFRGVCGYLEDFLARIDAPLLHTIWIYYFNQLVDFDVPQLRRFIDHSENLNQPTRCYVHFQHSLVSFGATPVTHIHKFFDDFPLHIVVRILCEGIDLQVSHLAQALNQISAVLSNVVHFAIGYNSNCDSVSPDPEGMDDIEWLQLLLPFSSVKTLFVSREFAGHISRSLEYIAAVMATEVLPALEMLCLEDHTVSSIHEFIAIRRESGHPVTIVDTKRAFMERIWLYQ
jgi:hypothetical protein